MKSNSGQIRLLPSEVVDQIAAGEVVERPAHLVKELVENALDAGATSIEVEFDQGGRRVRVTDDGKGIVKDELKLALARHATSKIEAPDDLWRLSTFGFRGEALASIAAVSRLTLQSRTAGADSAYKITSEFGKLSDVEPAGGNQGTTVIVEELFANVPARLKFMKSESAESAQIKAVLKALALVNEGVEFRIRTKGKLEFVWPKASGFLERARQMKLAEKLFESRLEYEGFKAHVLFASPHEVAGNARQILIFVQRRWVQDRGLQAAVNDAYRGLLMHGEFPIAVVRLEAPADEVDVNIHPTKSQIKFRDSQPAFRAVNRALREGLEKAPWLETVSTPAMAVATTAAAATVESAAPQVSKPSKRLSVADLTRAYNGPKMQTSEEPDFKNTPPESIARFEAPEFQTVNFRKKLDLAAFSTASNVDAATRVENAVTSFAETEANFANKEKRTSQGHWSRLQIIGQANLTYMIAQDETRLVLIDQHAAHERVAYERLMRAWKGGAIETQAFLLPLTVELDVEGAEALMKIQEELDNLGVAIDQSGPQAIVVRSKPAIIGDGALVQALQGLARELVDRGGSFQLEKKISDLCATMACHSVVRAGQALSMEQMRRLLEQMDEFPLSSFCPHGRPVSIEFSFARLERDFGRIV